MSVTKLLHRLGFTYKKPKIIPGKAKRARQEQFLKRYEEIKTNLGDNDRIYSLDSTHPEHNTKPSYGWILKGKANDKYHKFRTSRHCEPRRRRGVAISSGLLRRPARSEAPRNDSFLQKSETAKLVKKQKKGRIYLILDNAGHHHAGVVKRWILHHPRFKLIFLPTYSPNLNLIERLWRFFHQKITWNRYFETFEEFRKASLNFFENLNLYQNELSLLLTDSFQLVPA